jgi:hypothetical protein
LGLCIRPKFQKQTNKQINKCLDKICYSDCTRASYLTSAYYHHHWQRNHYISHHNPKKRNWLKKERYIHTYIMCVQKRERERERESGLREPNQILVGWGVVTAKKDAEKEGGYCQRK